MRKRAFLVGTHQTAVARDIRGQNSCQSPLYALAAQDAHRSSWKMNAIYKCYISELWADVPLMPKSETAF